MNNNSLISNIQNKYNLRKAKKIAETINNSKNTNIITTIPENIKIIILENNLLTSSQKNYELIESLNIQDTKINMIQKYIDIENLNNEKIQELSENIKYTILKDELIKDKSVAYNLINNLKDESNQNEMLEKYTNINYETTLKDILSIPENLRVKALKEKLDYIASITPQLLDTFQDEEIYTLFQNNKQFLEYYSKIHYDLYENKYRIRDISTTPCYAIYNRITNIKNNDIKEKIKNLVNIENLENEIDNAILKDETKCIKIIDKTNNFSFITDNMKKEKVIENLPIYDTYEFINKILPLYNNLSKDAQKTYRNFIITDEKINNFMNENIEIPPTIVKDYLNNDEYDQKLFKKLFLVSELVNEEQSKYSIYESINPTRIQLFTLMNDNDKKEVLTNENYIRNTAGEHDIFYNKFKLAEQLKDDYLDIIQKIYYSYNNWTIPPTSVTEDFSKYFKELSEDKKLEIIQAIYSKNKEEKMIMFENCLQDIENTDTIIKALKLDLYDHYNKEKRENNQEKYKNEQNVITNLISKFENTDKLLQNTDLNKIQEPNILYMLTKASKEVRTQIINNNNINPNIINICKNEYENLIFLTQNLENKKELITAYEKLLKEKPENIKKKMIYLKDLQKSNNKAIITTSLELLDNNILQAFGGIDGMEKILKYPKTQEKILEIKNIDKYYKNNGYQKGTLDLIEIVNNYLKDNLENPDYSLNEILEKQTEQSLRQLTEYINTKGTLTEEEIATIYNILSSNGNIKYTTITPENYQKELNRMYERALNNNNETIKNAYLQTYYSLNYNEAQKRVSEYELYINNLPPTEENIPKINYINSLKNIINSNEEILKIAYQKSKQEQKLNRIDMDIIEEDIKLNLAQEYNKTLFNPENKSTSDTITYNGTNIPIYDSGDNFNMLVSVLDAYGGGNGNYEDYFKQWNTTENAGNQRICTSYIGNNNLALVKRHNCIIMGFDNIENRAIVNMAPYDLQSDNNRFVTKTYKSARYMNPSELIKTTRRYNELDIERTTSSGNKRNPSYIISFASSKEEIEENQLKAAQQFNIPIVMINQDRIHQNELQKITNMINEFIETKNTKLIPHIIEDFMTNKSGSKDMPKDIDPYIPDKYKNTYEKKYFSDEKLKEILNIFINSAKEEANQNNELAQEIIEQTKNAINKEKFKNDLWQIEQRKTDPYFDEVPFIMDYPYFLNERQELKLYQQKENLLEEINKIDNNTTTKQYEHDLKNNKLPQEAYDINMLKEDIENLTNEEIKEINAPIKNDFIDYNITKLFASVLYNKYKPQSISFDIISNTIMPTRELSEDETELTHALYLSNEKLTENMRNQNITEEDLSIAQNIVYDARHLEEITSRTDYLDKKHFTTELGEKMQKCAYQINEYKANKKIKEVIKKEGLEKNEEEIYNKLCENKLPIEVAENLNIPNKGIIYEEKTNEKQR